MNANELINQVNKRDDRISELITIFYKQEPNYEKLLSQVINGKYRRKN